MISKFIKYLPAIILATSSVLFAQNSDKSANDLYKNAEQLIQERDYEKAKLTAKLYQKYVENNQQRWLKGQELLIRCEIELNNYQEASSLIKKSIDIISKSPTLPKSFEISMKLLQAELHEIKNEYEEAENIYRRIQKQNLTDVRMKLANNLIDRVISNLSKTPKNDYEELRKIVSDYEKDQARNPLELIRIKQKIGAYRMVNEEALKGLEKLNNYWIQKDEFTLFRIYLNSVLRKYDNSYKIWQENKAIISMKTHPMTVPVLSNLARHYLPTDLKKSLNISNSLPSLVRDSRDQSSMTALQIDLLIQQGKASEALNTYKEFTKIYANPPHKHNMVISLAEAFMEARETDTCRSLLKEIENDQIKDAELKSRKIFVEASLLQAAGKDEEAAVLFLRVGQTAASSETALKSLFMAGKAFYKADQCNRAIIAFKILLEKPRNGFTDEGMYYLSLSHAQCKEFKQALDIVDKLVITGKTPEFKKKALFNKGSYYLQSGSTEKAIDAYNDYTVVYSKDSRNAAIWYRIYNIYKSRSKFKEASQQLDKIITKSSGNAPEVYSKALHQKALLHLIQQQPRESIKLWQKFLEFNAKSGSALTDEVKIMLASAYQNSDTLDLAAAKSIYSEILTDSKDKRIREIAAYNLTELLGKSSKSDEETLSSLLKAVKLLDKSSADSILDAVIDLPDKKRNKLVKAASGLVKTLQDKEQKLYWQTVFDILKAKKINLGTHSKLDSLESDEYRFRALIFMRNFYSENKQAGKALEPALEIIYTFSSQLNNNNYFDWHEVHKSALIAVVQLKKKGMISQAEKIRDRLQKSNIPGQEKTVKEIERLLKEAG